MRLLIFALVAFSCSVAAAQWGYVPIERSYSYWSVGRYSGPVYPGAAYYGGSYMTVYPPQTVYLRWDALDPLVVDRLPRYRRVW